MTEDEAYTKACCGPPILGAVLLVAAGKGEPTPAAGRCIASACMAWREVGEWRIRSDYPWEAGKPRGEHVGPNNEVRSSGYCGLAGAPA